MLIPIWSFLLLLLEVSWLELLDPKRTLRGGVFLSPSGTNASCSHFVPLSYLELVSALLEAPAAGPILPSEEIVLGSYLKTLSRNIGFISLGTPGIVAMTSDTPVTATATPPSGSGCSTTLALSDTASIADFVLSHAATHRPPSEGNNVWWGDPPMP